MIKIFLFYNNAFTNHNQKQKKTNATTHQSTSLYNNYNIITPIVFDLYLFLKMQVIHNNFMQFI